MWSAVQQFTESFNPKTHIDDQFLQQALTLRSRGPAGFPNSVLWFSFRACTSSHRFLPFARIGRARTNFNPLFPLPPRPSRILLQSEADAKVNEVQNSSEPKASPLITLKRMRTSESAHEYSLYIQIYPEVISESQPNI